MDIISVMTPPFRVRRADWSRDVTQLRQVRAAVFVVEQGVPLDLEWDGIDAECAHVLAYNDDNLAIGTGRLLSDGHIGRMAVLEPWRHRGVGSALLRELMAIAKERGMQEVVLNAQIQASAFYERHGFVAEGESFLDAGIPHLRMRRPLR